MAIEIITYRVELFWEYNTYLNNVQHTTQTEGQI